MCDWKYPINCYFSILRELYWGYLFKCHTWGILRGVKNSLKSASRELVQDSGNSVRKNIFSRIFKMRYLRDYLELEKIKIKSPHLLVEICSFPGSFEMTETIREYQNMFSLQKNMEVKKHKFFKPPDFFIKKT